VPRIVFDIAIGVFVSKRRVEAYALPRCELISMAHGDPDAR
jgi:hypothetical protein